MSKLRIGDRGWLEAGTVMWFQKQPNKSFIPRLGKHYESYEVVKAELYDALVAQLAALPPAMTWTTQKPTKPGWYWYRNNDVPLVVYVYEAVGGLYFEYPTGECEECVSAQCVLGEWAGPIAPPMEPPQ